MMTQSKIDAAEASAEARIAEMEEEERYRDIHGPPNAHYEGPDGDDEISVEDEE